MIDETTPPLELPAAKSAKRKQGGKGKPFKKGYDPNRWMKGRGVKSPEQREGEEILRAVIWEELSREFDVATMKPLEQSETIDAMRLMVRTWIKKKPEEIANRIAGKVTERVDLTSGGKPIKGYATVTPDDWKKNDDNNGD